MVFSDLIKGIGFVEGGSYYSAQAFSYEEEDLTPDLISNFGIEAADYNSEQGLISNTDNL